MSFKIDNITPFANNAKRGKVPVLWSYYNGDDDTVTTAGYIPYSSEFTNGDQVFVIKKDYSGNSWYNVSITGKIISLVANG